MSVLEQSDPGTIAAAEELLQILKRMILERWAPKYGNEAALNALQNAYVNLAFFVGVPLEHFQAILRNVADKLPEDYADLAAEAALAAATPVGNA